MRKRVMNYVKLLIKALNIVTKQTPIDCVREEGIASRAENERSLLLWRLLQGRREQANIALHGLFYKSSGINQSGNGWSKRTEEKS